MMTLEVADLSPYGSELSADDDKWLAKLAQIDTRDYRVGIEPEPAAQLRLFEP